MPELQPHTSSASSSNRAPSPPQPNDGLSGLTKMSTTAGLGSGDYVAINTLAIASILLGLASMIVPLLGDELLQIIPLAALVTAVVAWRQIQRSNGTQTGKGLAAAGAALALLIGGGTFAVKAVTAWNYAPDTRVIAGIVQKLGSELEHAAAETPAAEPRTQPTYGPTTRSQEYIDRMIQVDRHYRNAYLMFSGKFRDRISLERFTEVWSQVNRSGSGGIKSMEWNGHIEFDTDTGSGAPQAVIWVWLRVKNSNEVLHEGMVFAKESNKWEIDNIPSLFEEAPVRKR